MMIHEKTSTVSTPTRKARGSSGIKKPFNGTLINAKPANTQIK
jgi:hypothetical protein